MGLIYRYILSTTTTSLSISVGAVGNSQSTALTGTRRKDNDRR